MDPQKPFAEPVPAPRLGIRLLWWFGIYFTAQLPLLIFAGQLKGWEWLAFPLGIAYPLDLVLGGIAPQAVRDAANTNRWISGFFEIVPLLIPFLVYLIHFILTWRARRRPIFRLLMWILGAIVLFNLASCASFLHNPPQ